MCVYIFRGFAILHTGFRFVHLPFGRHFVLRRVNSTLVFATNKKQLFGTRYTQHSTIKIRWIKWIKFTSFIWNSFISFASTKFFKFISFFIEKKLCFLRIFMKFIFRCTNSLYLSVCASFSFSIISYVLTPSLSSFYQQKRILNLLEIYFCMSVSYRRSDFIFHSKKFPYTVRSGERRRIYYISKFAATLATSISFHLMHAYMWWRAQKKRTH